ncbi:NAD(P)H-dependent oxidoreductase [Microbacterium sp. zg.B48]|uniref:NADPH-dependent FMN reductase n=1 Tax=Microbacterium sp. zg.B48 TaxID=2969408 RepID=UPI00214C20DB|nr:NAD(P)H-dependent oxidoreductase [Microbacterium sp. zg.B48]MCR2765084.1 NAD(P)H-dependent oxidoreductase [Microbacterium sp. zg.B48]
MTLRVSIVVGNPKPQSRTLAVTAELAQAIVGESDHSLRVIDLVEHVEQIFSWPSAEMAELNAAVAESDLVLFGSPTYKATYTGLLKAFLDRYPANGLQGVVAVPMQTGADLAHSLGPSFGLIPLLLELGAVVPGRGFYFVTGQMNTLGAQVRCAADEYRAQIARVAALGSALAGPSAPSTPGLRA